jgi:tRNA G18 (ribose-2'-O)-methylase SpoU
VLLSPGCCDPLYRKAIRTSMAMTLRVPYARAEPWPDMLEDLRAGGFMLAALSLREPWVSLRSFTSALRAERVALLVGAEGSGLSDAVERRADARVRIPISDAVDSLNLAVATGIALSLLARV